jgi:GT2 family glycosyltransferase
MRWCAGIVNHGSYDDLEHCLAGLARQVHLPAAIVVYDTGEAPDQFEVARLAHPEAAFEMGPNRGYAGGANQVVDRLVETVEGVDFILLLNPDVELEPAYASRLIAAMLNSSRVAIGTGKLLRPDRRTLDSAGIVIPRNRRPRDRGSDRPDLGQFDVPEFVDAASGAAMMLRVAAIEDLAVDGELFDESFFAYHEDTDLCWRARLFGWKIHYEPQAVSLHRRGWQRDRRSEIPIATRRHSFKNHYLQLVKNETASGFIRNLPWLLSWEFLRLGFVLLRDRPMGAAYLDAWKALPEARRKRAQIQTRARRSSKFR